jgi:hypothetical protein
MPSRRSTTVGRTASPTAVLVNTLKAFWDAATKENEYALAPAARAQRVHGTMPMFEDARRQAEGPLIVGQNLASPCPTC